MSSITLSDSMRCYDEGVKAAIIYYEKETIMCPYEDGTAELTWFIKGWLDKTDTLDDEKILIAAGYSVDLC